LVGSARKNKHFLALPGESDPKEALRRLKDVA
jgi:hypothetical protein